MATRGKATGKSERLAVLNNAEQEAPYGLPDFDDAQRLEFLALDESEPALACGRQERHAQLYCILEIACVKVRHLFFRFGWCDVEDDCNQPDASIRRKRDHERIPRSSRISTLSVVGGRSPVSRRLGPPTITSQVRPSVYVGVIVSQAGSALYESGMSEMTTGMTDVVSGIRR